jgi:hypothetical protein
VSSPCSSTPFLWVLLDIRTGRIGGFRPISRKWPNLLSVQRIWLCWEPLWGRHHYVTLKLELFLPDSSHDVTSDPNLGGTERRPEMLDPVMYHLHQARETATWVAQLMRIDPELMLPAALPLLAARLMDAGGIEDESDFEDPEAQPGLAVG